MNNFTNTALNGDIPVIYRGMSINIYVKYVIMHTVIGVVFQDIDAFTLEDALTPVNCVIKDSVNGTL